MATALVIDDCVRAAGSVSVFGAVSMAAVRHDAAELSRT